MKIELSFEGSKEKFEKALLAFDDKFDLADSIIWELDYGTGESLHSTKYGDITIKKTLDK